jgi:hypothetical protein
MKLNQTRSIAVVSLALVGSWLLAQSPTPTPSNAPGFSSLLVASSQSTPIAKPTTPPATDEQPNQTRPTVDSKVNMISMSKQGGDQ